MKKQMLRRSAKRLVTEMIIAAALLAAAFVLAGETLINSIRGPVDIASFREGIQDGEYLTLEEYDSLEGRYVTIDVECILDEYYEKISRNTKTGASSIMGIGYIAYDRSSGYAFSIYVSNVNRAAFDKLMAASHKPLSEGSSKHPEALRIKGTFRKMTGSELWDFNNASEKLEYLFANEEQGDYPKYAEYTLMYTIDTTGVAGVNAGIAGIAAVIAIPSFTWFVINVLRLVTGAGFKKVKKFMSDNNIDKNCIEDDFAAAHRFNNVYVGREYTYFMKGAGWNICRNADLVWAYYFYRVKRRSSISRIEAYHYDKTVTYIKCTRKVAEQVLSYYYSMFPQIIVGYSMALEVEFKREYDKFLLHKYEKHDNISRNSEELQGDMTGILISNLHHKR